MNLIRGKRNYYGLPLAIVIIYLSGCHQQSSFEKNFKFLVDQSNKTILDLSHLNSADWDEVVYLEPFADVCDLNISGYVKGNKSCFLSKDENDTYLLFLKDNILVEKVSVDRKKTDFSKSKLNGKRLKKSETLFQFESKDEYPKLLLIPSANMAANGNVKPVVGDQRIATVRIVIEKVDVSSTRIYFHGIGDVIRANGNIVTITQMIGIDIHHHNEPKLKSCLDLAKPGARMIVSGKFESGLPDDVITYIQAWPELYDIDSLKCDLI